MNFSFDQLPDIYSRDSRRIIQTPSEFARKALYYVQETGYLKLKKSHRASRKNLSSYLFVLVLSGSGTLVVNDTPYSLWPGDCFFIDCMDPYYHQTSVNDPWELYWVHFNGSASGDYHQFFQKQSPPVLSPRCFSSLKSGLEELLFINSSSDLQSEIESSRLIVELLSLLLLEITQKTSGQFSAKSKQEEIRAYLDEHYLDKFSLEELSEKFYLSKYHLSRQFKQHFGSSPGRYVMGKRITYAKKLLRFSSCSLEETAQKSGFYDASYFNKQFTKAEGISPSDYRKKWKN